MVVLAAAAAGIGSLGWPAAALAEDDGDAVYRRWREGKPETLEIDKRGLRVVFDGDAPASATREAWVWIRRAADAMRRYFGTFPVERLALLVQWRDGAGIGRGTSWGYDGSIVRVAVGRETAVEAFANDWILVHELVHAALPTLSRQHLWLMEGSATYVEPVARTLASQRNEADLWHEFVRGMPKGLPGEGDEGLDRTHTWGRTYWGGALFYLAVDVDMRVATHNKRGLQDALIAINQASGGNAATWSVERYLSIGDQATGTDALSRRYEGMAKLPARPDLEDLWRRLGVLAVADEVRLDDRAPWAETRRAITGSTTVR
jgi:hypothetical protein